MNTWQPIETAPSDEPILIGLLVRKGGGNLRTADSHLFNVATLSVEGLMVNDELITEWAPTHWMPIPEFPAHAKSLIDTLSEIA